MYLAVVSKVHIHRKTKKIGNSAKQVLHLIAIQSLLCIVGCFTFSNAGTSTNPEVILSRHPINVY